MKWKFWSTSAEAGTPKLPKPQEMPQPIGQYLVTKLKQDPDLVWNYKAALMPREGSTTAFSVRIYSPASADDLGVRVANFASLDEATDLILFQGWYDKGSGKVDLSRPAAPPRAA